MLSGVSFRSTGNFFSQLEKKSDTVLNGEKALMQPTAKVIQRHNLGLTHISLPSLLLDVGKQYSPRCDAAECGVQSGAILFAKRNFNEK